MAHSKTPSLIILLPIFIAFSSAEILNLPASTISAAPALLPDPISPSSSANPPTLSPDIAPLLPSPGGSELSPSESSLPFIPSSPSPPNPDAMVAPWPGMALEPTGLLPDYSSARVDIRGFLSLMAVAAGAILVNGAF